MNLDGSSGAVPDVCPEGFSQQPGRSGSLAAISAATASWLGLTYRCRVASRLWPLMAISREALGTGDYRFRPVPGPGAGETARHLLAGRLPASISNHLDPYLPSNAGGAIWGGAVNVQNPLSPWTGFALLCGYAVILIGAGAWRLR